MPAPVYINVNKSYRIEWISAEVEQLINEIQSLRTQMTDLDLQKSTLGENLRVKQQELLSLYVQQTGQLPT